MINLTRVKGCYSRELKKKYSKIHRAALTETVSPERMKEIIYKIVLKAYINKEAKPRFIRTLARMKNKNTMLMYVERVIAAGTYYRPENKKAN